MGKENGTSGLVQNRFSRSMRVERAATRMDASVLRSQSVSAAAGAQIKPLPLHPAELEKRHSHMRRKSSGLFGSKPSVSFPRVDSATNVFLRLQTALSDGINYMQDALGSVEPKRKRIVEQRLSLMKERLKEIEEMYQLYVYEQKMRDGARNLLQALETQGSSRGQDKCRSSYKVCTQRMCEIEDELESKLGVFKFHLNALVAFGRLCSGDVYEVLIRHGANFKFKSRCKIDRDGQRWSDAEFKLRPSIADELMIRVIEMKKIQSNIQVGNILLRSRNYIKARPQTFAVPLNSTGSMKLKMTVEWSPFTWRDENSAKAKRQSLLSDVIFVPSTPTVPESPGSEMAGSSSSSWPSSLSESASRHPERNSQTLRSTDEAIVDATDFVEFPESGNPDLQDGEDASFRHATSLDRALEHIIPTLHSHKDLHPELSRLIKQLEQLEELLKKCPLSKTDMTLSVESALDSFDFLEDDLLEEAETTPRSEKSGESVVMDTGYSSTDDFPIENRSSSTPESLPTREKVLEAVSNVKHEDISKDVCISDIISVLPGSPLNENAPSGMDFEFDRNETPQSVVSNASGVVVSGDVGVSKNGDIFKDVNISENAEIPKDVCISDVISGLAGPRLRGSPTTADVGFSEIKTTGGELERGGESEEAARCSCGPTDCSCSSRPRDNASTAYDNNAVWIERKGSRMADEKSEVSSKQGPGKPRTSLSSSRPTSPNLSSSTGEEVTLGHRTLDKIVLCHLQFCEEVIVYLGSFGPMKFKEMQALQKLRQQSEIMDQLVELALAPENVDTLTLHQACPKLVSSTSQCYLWEKSTCKSSPLVSSVRDVTAAFCDVYQGQITQNYNRVADQVFPVVVSRLVHQDTSLLDSAVDGDELISAFQFELFFADHARQNLPKFIDEVAYEVLIGKRLISPEKEAVVAQLKQYAEIPLVTPCFTAVLLHLLDTDHHVLQAAESFLLNLMKDADSRKTAIRLSTEALEESDERMREAGCEALTVLQARDAVEELLYLSRCDVPSVKQAANKALSSFGQEGADALKQSTFSASEIAGLLY